MDIKRNKRIHLFSGRYLRGRLSCRKEIQKLKPPSVHAVSPVVSGRQVDNNAVPDTASSIPVVLSPLPPQFSDNCFPPFSKPFDLIRRINRRIAQGDYFVFKRHDYLQSIWVMTSVLSDNTHRQQIKTTLVFLLKLLNVAVDP